MHGDERVPSQRQPLRDPQAGRELVAPGARRRESCLADRAQLLLGEVLGGRVDRREVGRVRGIAEVVRLDREAVPVLSAAQPGGDARGQLRLEPRLVEPRGPDLTRVVGDVGRENVETPTPPARSAPHGHLDHGLLVTEELADRPLGRGALVAARPVRQHVAHAAQPEPRQPARGRRADTGQRLDRGLERLRMRRGACPGPGHGRVRAREAGRQPGTGRCARHASSIGPGPAGRDGVAGITARRARAF